MRVLKQNRGVFDTMPLALLTAQSVAALGALVGSELDVQRFRPNLLVDAHEAHEAHDADFPEDRGLGGVLAVGAFRMRVDRRDRRCVMVNIDPETTARDPAVLRAIARERQACLGVYGSTVEPGCVAVGDPVVLEV